MTETKRWQRMGIALLKAIGAMLGALLLIGVANFLLCIILPAWVGLFLVVLGLLFLVGLLTAAFYGGNSHD